MKKFLIAAFCMLNMNLMAQEPENKLSYHSETGFSIDIGEEQCIEIFQSISSIENYSGTFTKVYIDDPQPLNPESFAYLIFEGENEEEETRLTSYFLLSKTVLSDFEVIYPNFNITQESMSAGSGSCTGVKCEKCKPERNWPLGPITRCKCKRASEEGGTCNHTRSNSSPGWWEIVAVLISILV